jgi:LysR family hydrogen peroxide-inducible transcriptional activator
LIVPTVFIGIAYIIAAMTQSSSFAGLSLRDLEYAVAVAQTRHFGRAALRCGVSQPALSEQVRKLEALLGTVLFERGRKGVQITAHGHALLAQAERVLAEAHGLVEMAHESSEPLTSALRLGAIQTLGPYYLPYLLRQVRAAFPRLSLRLAEGQTDALVDDLRSGVADAILAAEPVPGEGLATDTLFFEPFVLVCPVGHRLASLPRLHLKDLAADDLILLEEGHCLRDQALSLCAGAASQMRHATSVETLWHMIAAGEGYSLLPALSLTGRQAMADLVTCRPLPEADAGRTIALAWRATDPRGPEMRQLAELLRGALPEGVKDPRTRLAA